MDKYFPDDVCKQKEIESFELKQSNIYVADYATNFEELSRYFLQHNGVDAKGSKCVKFKNRLCPEIKQFIGYQEIYRSLVLVNKCRIYEENNRATSTHYNVLSEKKFSNHNRGKPYAIQVSK